MSPTIQTQTEARGGVFKGLKRSVLGGESFFLNTFTPGAGGGEVTFAPSVLVRAFREDSRGHTSAATWLADALAGDSRLAISGLALSAPIRIVSHPGRSHWDIFLSLVERPGVHGKVVPDACYADDGH